MLYSAHKFKNLGKMMMVVAADGYILDAEGLYYADGGNNDAYILKDMLMNSHFKYYFIDDDHLILDRGFRDSIQETELHGLRTYMPKCLAKN